MLIILIFEKRKTYLLHLKLSLGSTRSRSSASEDCSVTMSVSSIPESQRKNLNALGRSANNINIIKSENRRQSLANCANDCLFFMLFIQLFFICFSKSILIFADEIL